MTSRPQLKLPDPVVDVNDPWSEDRLNRKNYAPLLTGVVEDEENVWPMIRPGSDVDQVYYGPQD